MQYNNEEDHMLPTYQIRALHDNVSIRVYQAFSNAIADAALSKGKFAASFKMDRMTWIKPSFLWMMYRAGWGEKDDGQRRILAIDITREGFEWALKHACLSHAGESMTPAEWQQRKQASPVRIQWDPERDLQLHRQAHRSIQIGLQKAAVDLYVNEWTCAITDVTPLSKQIHQMVLEHRIDEAQALLPAERPYIVRSGITIPMPMPQHTEGSLAASAHR